MLLRKARTNGFVLPPPLQHGSSEKEAGYKGGAVLNPLAGYYNEPIVTLDLASLYPSILQRHNMCYSTLIPPGATAPGTSNVSEVNLLLRRYLSKDTASLPVLCDVVCCPWFSKSCSLLEQWRRRS